MGPKHPEKGRKISEMPGNKLANLLQSLWSLVISSNPTGGEDTFTTAFHVVSDDIISPVKSCTPRQPYVLTAIYALGYAIKRYYKRLVYTDSHEINYSY